MASERSLDAPLKYEYSEYPPQPQDAPNKDIDTSRGYRMKKRAPAQIYFCVQCNKQIKYPSKISEHIRKHTGEKPHRCSVCGQCFSQAHSLKDHMQLHGSLKPYKCSYCDMSFFNVAGRHNHEKKHLGEQNNEDINCEQYEDGHEEQNLCGIYECAFEGCGFQSYEEGEVTEHIHMVHEYDDGCWDAEEQVVQGVDVDDTNEQEDEQPQPSEIKEYVCADGLIVNNFNTTGEMFEYFHEQFQSDIPSTSADAQPTNVQCTSNTIIESQSGEIVEEDDIAATSELIYSSHFPPDAIAPLPLTEVEIHTSHNDLLNDVIYADDIDVEDEHVGVEKHLEYIATNKNNIAMALANEFKPEDDITTQSHLYGQINMDDTVQVVDDEDERVRMVVNPNPPKRGTRSQKDYEGPSQMIEMVVDASLLEMTAPTRHLKQGYIGPLKKKKPNKSAKNLDWIIEAVSKGEDVNTASPHHRKKPTLHKCEYCGKIDKYPSKIQAHMRTHTGEKPFKCDICGAGFAQRTPLRLHLRRHLDQRPYECLIAECKERFVSGALLKMHVETKHLNKKKHVCGRGCGRVFASAHNLRVHEAKCSQNLFMAWNEGEESEEEINGEYVEEEDDTYMDNELNHLVEDELTDEHIQSEEPVFLHQ